jgi:predicted outer membrane protein
MSFAAINKWVCPIALSQALSLGMAATSGAEDAPVAKPRESVRQSQPGREAGQKENLDSHFAACLILGNQNEIASAKLAEQRSKSPEVKKFAAMIEKDHQQFINELEKFGGDQFRNRNAAQGEAAETRRDSRTEDAGNDRPKPKTGDRNVAERRTERTAKLPPGRNAPRNGTATGLPTAPGAPHDIHLQIKQEVADECLASTQRELSSKEGREFDACYIGMQLAAHMYMIDELKVLERHASPELQEVLRTGLETSQKHLTQAKEIMKDIDKGETRKTSAK